MYAKFFNYEFWLDRVALRHVVLTKGISLDLSKIEVVMAWQRLRSAKEV